MASIPFAKTCQIGAGILLGFLIHKGIEKFRATPEPAVPRKSSFE
jgi:hypothetical protein